MDFFLFQKDCRVSAMGFNSFWISCMYFQLDLKVKSFVCVCVFFNFIEVSECLFGHFISQTWFCTSHFDALELCWAAGKKTTVKPIVAVRLLVLFPFFVSNCTVTGQQCPTVSHIINSESAWRKISQALQSENNDAYLRAAVLIFETVIWVAVFYAHKVTYFQI